jgi:hypothetical protein
MILDENQTTGEIVDSKEHLAYAALKMYPGINGADHFNVNLSLYAVTSLELFEQATTNGKRLSLPVVLM